MDWELWGTFSVGDHLRRRAYVADVLLYDRLVIPTPPDSDSEEEKRWHDMGWRPELQRKLLDRLNQDRKRRVLRVPWTEVHRYGWEERYRNALAHEHSGIKGAAVRTQMAEATVSDVSAILEARKSLRRKARPEEVDELAHFTSRQYLVDWSNMKKDTQLFVSVPKAEVDAVAAYGSYQDFTSEVPVTPEIEPVPSSDLLNLFGWEFLVPNDSKRSDEDLLKQALELANLDETKQHRQAFHKWRREATLTGESPREVLDEMEQAIQDYRAAVRKSKVITGVKYAFAAVTAASSAAAVVMPPLGIAGAFAGFGAFMVSESYRQEMPEELKVAAMFYDARKRFGWRR